MEEPAQDQEEGGITSEDAFNPASGLIKASSQLSVELSDSSYSSCDSEEGLFASCFQDARVMQMFGDKRPKETSDLGVIGSTEPGVSHLTESDTVGQSDSDIDSCNAALNNKDVNFFDAPYTPLHFEKTVAEDNYRTPPLVRATTEAEERVPIAQEDVIETEYVGCQESTPVVDFEEHVSFNTDQNLVGSPKIFVEIETSAPHDSDECEVFFGPNFKNEEIEFVEALEVDQDETNFAAFHTQLGSRLEEKTLSPQFSPQKERRLSEKDEKQSGLKGGLKRVMNRVSLRIEDYDIIDSKELKQAEQEECRKRSSSDVGICTEKQKQGNSFNLGKFLHWSRDDKTNCNSEIAQDVSNDASPCLTKFKNGIDLHYSVKTSDKGEVIEEIKMTPSVSNGKHDNKGGSPPVLAALSMKEAPANRRNSPVFYDILGTPELENLGITEESHSKSSKKARSPRSIKKVLSGGSLRGSKWITNMTSNGGDYPNNKPSKEKVVMTGYNKKTSSLQKKNSTTSLDTEGSESDFDYIDADMANNCTTRGSEAPTEHSASSIKVKLRPHYVGKKPVPPPRRKKVKSLHLVDQQEGSNDAIEKRRATLGTAPEKGSISNDNIFKGLIPFFEGDPKRRGSLVPLEKSITLPPRVPDRLVLMTDSFPTSISDFPADRRSLIALELYTTERSFVRGLETTIQLFKWKLTQAGYLDAKESETVFGNVDEIYAFNKDILISLWKRISNWSDDQKIADIFNENIDGFKKFSVYCQNYDAAEAFIKQKLKKKKEMESFLNTCYSNPVCQPGLTLPSYLITVVQRIPRYVLLLKDLVKRTPENHPDSASLKAALSSMEKVATYINEQLKLSQSEKALEALQSQIIGLKDYYISGRTLCYENTVCLMTVKKTYKCVLFNDLLVFAAKTGGRTSEVELVLDLSIVWFEDLGDLDPQTTKEDAIALYSPDRPYTLYVGNKGEKKLWLQHLEKAISKHLYGKDTPEKTNLERRNTNHTYKNGAVYSGEFLNAKRHGQGTMMWPNQMTYRGQWLDDERNGVGILEYGTGEVYKGQWADDNQYGQGELIYSSMDVFIGEWTRGIRHGKGQIQFQNGDIFQGTFANDRIEGKGKLVCKNGLVYDGTWARNMKEGYGYLKDIEGNEYRGHFKEDKFHGKGEMMYVFGAVYNGSWEYGKRQGLGVFKEMNGISYDGQWMDDFMEGHGTLTCTNGDIYEGTWIQGKKFGTGTMNYNDGNFYNGQWEDDFPSGEGTMFYKNGGKYTGDWKFGRRSGNGTMTYKTSEIYKGCWKDDNYNGTGRHEKPSGWTYDGLWVSGKRSGHGVLSDPLNNYKYEGEWYNDLKHGKGIEMMFGYVYEGDFKDDKRNGQGSQSSPDSSIYEGSWRKGQKHGKGVKRLPNGMRQNQIWQMGCLMETPAMVSRGLPQLERF